MNVENFRQEILDHLTTPPASLFLIIIVIIAVIVIIVINFLLPVLAKRQLSLLRDWTPLHP